MQTYSVSVISDMKGMYEDMFARSNAQPIPLDAKFGHLELKLISCCTLTN